jgi:7-carboxy-7-deazaguanine synthase
MLKVSEVFDTIQGEATYTGTPSWFIRLQGCDVGCPFCDTKYTWSFEADGPDPQDPQQALERVDALIARLQKGDVYKADPSIKGLTIHAVHLVDILKKKRPGIKHIVITGGEPMAQPEEVKRLCHYATSQGFSVQIETSGTYPIDVPSNIWVTVSPKIGMPGKRKVLKDSAQRADEIKFPVGKHDDVEKLNVFLDTNEINTSVTVWLQPLSQSPAATKLCIDTAMDNGWKLSLQTHKFIGLA